MIQRIQTLYLFVASVLMGLMLFLPIAEFYGASPEGTEELQLTAFEMRAADPATGGFVTILKTIPMGAVVAFSALLPLVTIFLYKKRLLQYRLSASEIVLLVGAQIFAIYSVFRAVKGMEGFDDSIYSLKLPFFFPFISIFFVWLAMRGIIKDIKIIKSLNRIR